MNTLAEINMCRFRRLRGRARAPGSVSLLAFSSYFDCWYFTFEKISTCQKFSGLGIGFFSGNKNMKVHQKIWGR